MLILGAAALVWAADAMITVGFYADATGTSGYIPAAAWIGGVGGVVALGIAIITMNRRPQAS